MEFLSRLVDNKRFQVSISILWLIILFVPIVMSFFRMGVDCDSAYYICMAERMLEGHTLYSHLRFTYTPLWILIEACLKIVFRIPNGVYWPYLLLHYVFQVLTVYAIYRFLLCVGTKRGVAFFCSTLYLLLVHYLSGNCVLLEASFILFGMMSCWLTLEFLDKKDWV